MCAKDVQEESLIIVYDVDKTTSTCDTLQCVPESGGAGYCK